MTTFNWSALTNGLSIAFNPAADVLVINDPTISADEFGYSFVASVSAPCSLTAGSKTITLQTAFASLTTSNLRFADGSVFIVGDNTSGTANDGAANTLTGGSGNDHLLGLGGDDSMAGGAGNDCLAMGFTNGIFGNDTINGGTGFDTLDYSSASTNAATVNLATHTATNAQGNTTLISIETVLGTAGDDVFTGGDVAHGVDSMGNTSSERFRGEAGNDMIRGGVGNGFFTYADYANNSNTQHVTANLATGVVLDGRGFTDTLVNVDGLRGGAGNDSLTGGSLSRTTNGTFFEILRGNAGNDILNGGNATSGGAAGSGDRADYSNSIGSVNVNLNTGVATDGQGGTDTLIDIDAVYGGSGNDSFIGSANNDDLDGGAGNDTLNGGAGSDTARFQQSIAGVIVNLSAASITVNTVTVVAGTANDGLGGTDTLISMENVRGSDFADYIRGSDDVNTRQFLAGDAGNDTIDGGAGIDFANYSDVAITLGGLNAFIENGAGTVIDKKGGTDTLINIEGLAGSNTQDTLRGGQGDQWFRGNGGNDSINGGAGSDWVLYSGDPSGVSIDLAAGNALDGWNGAGGLLALGGSDTLVSIENAEASDYDDTIRGTNAANELRGRAGNDSIDGGAGNDSIDGGAGADAMSGGLGNDGYIVDNGADLTIEAANEGTDTAQSSASNYTLGVNVENLILTGVGNINGSGNTGNNTLTGNSGNNVLNGGAGTDTASYANAAAAVTVNLSLAGPQNTGSMGSDTLTSIESLLGSAFRDTLTGNSGNNVLDGGVGVDTIAGGQGDDTYIVNSSSDVITEADAEGTDTAQSSASSYTLGANVEKLILTGVGNINGSGNAGNNILTGNSGNNVLSGGAGNDTLVGGSGADVFIYNSVDTSVRGGADSDTLQIAGSSTTLNLTTRNNSWTADLEIIDLTGTGNNSLVLALGDVLAFSSTTDTLRIDGNAGDKVTATDGGWIAGADQVIGANTYHSYTQAAAQLLIDADITSII